MDSGYRHLAEGEAMGPACARNMAPEPRTPGFMFLLNHLEAGWHWAGGSLFSSGWAGDKEKAASPFPPLPSAMER